MPCRPAHPTLLLRSLVSALAVAGSVLLPAAPTRAADEPPPKRPVIYRWIDENGIPHYTAQRGRVPSGLRDRVSEVTAGEPGAAAAASVAPAPAAPQDQWVARNAGAQPAPVSPRPPSEAAFREPASPGDAATLAPVAAVPRDGERGASASDLDGRIAALESEIAQDEDALQDLLSAAPGDGTAIATRPEFREIARRLPKRQADLLSLRDQRSRLGQP